jgi:hypothetical protein
MFYWSGKDSTWGPRSCMGCFLLSLSLGTTRAKVPPYFSLQCSNMQTLLRRSAPGMWGQELTLSRWPQSSTRIQRSVQQLYDTCLGADGIFRDLHSVVITILKGLWHETVGHLFYIVWNVAVPQAFLYCDIFKTTSKAATAKIRGYLNLQYWPHTFLYCRRSPF